VKKKKKLVTIFPSEAFHDMENFRRFSDTGGLELARNYLR